jgi:amino acid transporter
LSLAVLVAAFVVMALFALSFVEVASRFDRTGGPQLYAEAAFGPLAGFTVGWLFAVSRIAVFGAIAHVMLDYAAVLWPALEGRWPRAIAITAFIAALAAFNLRGVTRGAMVGNLLTVAKLLPLLPVALAGLWLAGWNDIPATAPQAPGGLARGLMLALFACTGFEVATIVAGEMRDPRRDLAAGILGGLTIACVLYLLVMFATFALLPDPAASARPLADLAEAAIGPVGGVLMAIAAVLCSAGGLAGQMLVAPRIFFALGESGDLPRGIAAVSPLRRTPYIAITVTATIAWLLTISGTFMYLVTIFVIARMVAYGATSAALIVLRRRVGPAPVSIPGGPAIAVAAIVCGSAIVLSTSWVAARDVAIALLVGFAVRTGVRWRAAGSTCLGWHSSTIREHP